MEKKQKVVYISGKISGLPAREVKHKFFIAEAELLKRGYAVINPYAALEHTVKVMQAFGIRDSHIWLYCMNICLALLEHADEVCLLPDWEDSDGARRERLGAIERGIIVRSLVDYGINFEKDIMGI